MFISVRSTILNLANMLFAHYRKIVFDKKKTRFCTGRQVGNICLLFNKVIYLLG
jgi:hypothetical protein